MRVPVERVAAIGGVLGPVASVLRDALADLEVVRELERADEDREEERAANRRGDRGLEGAADEAKPADPDNHRQRRADEHDQAPGRDKVVVVVGTRQVLLGVEVGARRDHRQDQGDDVRDHVEAGPHEAGRAVALVAAARNRRGLEDLVGANGRDGAAAVPVADKAARLHGLASVLWLVARMLVHGVGARRRVLLPWRAAGPAYPIRGGGERPRARERARARARAGASAKIIHYTPKSSTPSRASSHSPALFQRTTRGTRSGRHCTQPNPVLPRRTSARSRTHSPAVRSASSNV